jgi:hypothetical protein
VTVGISATQANLLLDAFTGEGSDYTAQSGFYVKLHTGDPGAAGASNAATETTREAVTFGSGASAGSIASTADVTWTSVSTSETYSHVSFWTASTSGTFLGSDDLASSVAVTAGDDFTIASGDLTIAITPVAA